MALGDDEKPKGIAKIKILCKTLPVKLAKGFQAAMTPSIQSYFFWSFLMYVGCGVAINIQVGSIHDFFCKVAPQKNETTDTGLGCDLCPDKLLLCTKGQGIRSAVNITYYTESTSPKDAYYQAFSAASADPICNSLVQSSNTVAEMVTNVLGAAAPSIPVESCKTYWCGVLKIVMTDTDLSADPGTDPLIKPNCTNVWLTKRPWEATECVCQADRDAADPAVSTLLEDCMIVLTDAPTPLPPGATPAPSAATPAPATGGRRRGPATPAGGGAAARRMFFEAVLSPPSSFAASGSAAIGASDIAELSLARLEELSLATLEAAVEAWVPDSWSEDDSMSFEKKEDNRISFSATSANQRRLQAEAPTAAESAAAANEALDPYAVTPYSSCTCYMQCIPGLMTRLVSCGSNKCMQPEPPSSAPCLCNHCADCDIKSNLELISITFLVQGLVAGLVCVSFMYFESKSEENREDALVRPRWLLCPLGMFCKTMPPLVRIFMLINFFQLAFIMATTWVPYEYVPLMADCGESSEALVCSGMTSSIWFLQLCMGRYAKLYTRQPPYLYSPERPGGLPGIRQLKHLLRSLGP